MSVAAAFPWLARLPAPAAVLEADGRCRVANALLGELLECPPAALVGRPLPWTQAALGAPAAAGGRQAGVLVTRSGRGVPALACPGAPDTDGQVLMLLVPTGPTSRPAPAGVEAELAGRLPQALRSAAVCPYFQPVVELTTGLVVGYEALARWEVPDGVLLPGAFLPLAERLGLAAELDGVILAAACRAAATWTCAGRPVWLSVNVGPGQLVHPSFVDSVVQALRSSGRDPDTLLLEVTETAPVSELGQARAALSALRRLGVRVAIDDFGTGYSSLLQLRDLPLDVLKIPRDFVQGLPGSSRDSAICASVLELAGQVSLEVVAEGIENPRQARALVRSGCRLGQGFLWSPAVPAGSAAALLREQPWRTPGRRTLVRTA